MIRTATVMFTDIVGSTELRLRLGEDGADELREHHDAALTEAVEANSGRVVKHLGDGVMAIFESCTDALSAAVAVQQAVDLDNRRSDAESLWVRIGVAVGDVSLEGDDCFGLSVVEARRLEAAASPGSVWCTDVVAAMSRGRGGHVFRSIGPVHLKGLDEPISVSEVRWDPIVEESVRDDSLPPALAGAGLPFAGRASMLAELVQSWNSCAGGGFELILVAGEPGVGKTRLTQELARRVLDGRATDTASIDGAIVLAGRCDERLSQPFQPFGAALEWFVRHEPAERLRDSLGDHPGDLARLMPSLGDFVADLPEPLSADPEAVRFRLFQAVMSWLTVGGVDRPRLLVIDDLHWADTSTVQLLRQLSQLQPAGVLVVCSYRDTDVGADHPLFSMLGEVRDLEAVTRFEVDGLGPEEVGELLARAGGRQLDANGLEFAQQLLRQTSGNPFFLGEVIRDVLERGGRFDPGGQWDDAAATPAEGIPGRVREVVAQRLNRLGVAIERVLRTASIIGYEFDVGLLADVLGDDADHVLDALEAAASAHLAVEMGVDRYRFAHAIVRETLHSEFSSSRRSREHRKVAIALEARHRDALDDVVPELATHWAESSAGGDQTRAAELAVRAGELAGSRGAYEDGAHWFERALLLIGDDPDRSDVRRAVLVCLAEAEGVSGASESARGHALEAARSAIEVGDPEGAVAALRVRARHSFSARDPEDPERVALLRDALLLDALSGWQRAALLGELAKELIFERDITGRREALDQQRTLIEDLPVLERVQLVATAGVTSYELPDRVTLLAQIDEALEVLSDESALSVSERWRVLGHVAYMALHVGDRSLLDESIASMEALGDAPGPVRFAMTLLHRTMRSVIDGDITDAELLADELVDRLENLAVSDAAAYRSTTLLATSRERGAMDELRLVIDRLEVAGHVAGPERAAGAFVRSLQGDLDRVKAALHDLDGEEFADDATLQLCLAYWAEVVAGLGHRPECERFIDRLGANHGLGLLIGGLYLGPADRLLGLLHDAIDDHEHADQCFAAAIEQQISLASRTWTVRTQLDWAASLLARGENDRARALLHAAAGQLAQCELTDSHARHDALAAHLAAAS